MNRFLGFTAGLALVVALALCGVKQADAQSYQGNYGIITGGSNVNAAPAAVTASRALTAADAGSDLTNAGSTGTVTLSVTPGLPIGTVFEVSQTDLHDIAVTFSGGEGVKIGTGAPATSISALSNTGTTTGSTFRIRKETATSWFLKYFEGSVG